MRVLLKNITTGRYLGQRGQWIDNPAAAKSFPDEGQAKDYFTFRKLPNTKVVMLPEPGEAQLQPKTPMPASKRALRKQPVVGAQEVVEPGLGQTQPEVPATPSRKEAPPVESTVETAEKQADAKPKSSGSQRGKIEQTEKVTTVEAKIDVGLGNALFIRGQGDGLSWDKGQPLNCINGTTWIWSTTQAKDKVVFKLLLNDQVWAKGEDAVVQAGKAIELMPAF